MRVRPRVRPLVAVLALAVITACQLDAQTREGMFERMLAVSGPVTLDVRTGSGNIQIHAGSPDSVRVVARIRGQSGISSDVEERIRRIESAPPIVQEGNTIRIGYSQDERLFRNISISYDVSVPSDARVQSHTGAGNQSIERLGGPLEVSSGSGNLVIRFIGGDVQASTGSGDIGLEEVGGNLVGRTGSGSITADGVRGSVDARTGSGRVSVNQTAEADVEIITGSGGIEVRGAHRGLRVRTGSGSIALQGHPGQDWDVESGSGSVTIDFADDSAFELNARAASGGITTRHPVTVLGASSGRQLRGTVRGGGARVDVSTGSGSIRVE
jgi:DUF4097 and DUF4098 domain-containing protein YvlB